MVPDRKIRVFSKKGKRSRALSTSSLALLVFGLSLVIRVALSFVFWRLFGSHASQCIEVWFFSGIASGCIEAPFSDPTTPLLAFMGIISPQSYVMNATSLLGAALSSLVATLVFIIGKEINGRKLGLVAALLYSAMAAPLFYGVTCFVHDLVQLPLFLSCLATFFFALRSTGRARIAWSALSLACFLLGTLVNIVIYMVLDVIAVVLAWRIVRWFSESRGISEGKTFALFMALLVVGIVAVRMFMLPSLVDRVLSYLPQGRTGSLDLVPMSAQRVWAKYGILLFFLPFGVWKCLRRRDVATLTLLLVSFSVSTLIERGSRLLDIGVPLTVGHAFLEWRKKESLLFLPSSIFIFVYMALESSPLFEFRFVTMRGLLMGFWSSPVLSGIVPLFVIVLIFLGALSFVSEKKALAVILSIFALYGCWSTFTTFTPRQFASFGTTDAEYNAYLFLEGKERAPLYVFWDHAYFAQSVSGLESISNAWHIDEEAENAMRLDEETAARYFSEAGVRYIVITTRDARIYLSKLTVQQTLTETLAYNLIQKGEELAYFKEIFSERDKKTGVVVKVFELRYPPLNPLEEDPNPPELPVDEESRKDYGQL